MMQPIPAEIKVGVRCQAAVGRREYRGIARFPSVARCPGFRIAQDMQQIAVFCLA